ncbi:MAG: PAS domain-containing protein [Lentisphaerae bacterium]|nr:PAS domain-containing protein [Lentisphaerota bacterium]
MSTRHHTAESATGVPWLRDAYEYCPDAVLVLNGEHSILSANPAAVRLLEPQDRALAGRRLDDFLPVDKKAQWQSNFNKLIAKDWHAMEGTIINGRGSECPVIARAVTIALADGHKGVLVFLQDILLFRNVEKALVASQDQWERSFDAITDGLCILDSMGRILRTNHAMKERFGPLLGNLIGIGFQELFHGESTPEIPHPVRQSPFSLPEVTLPRLPDRWFGISAYPKKDEGDAVTGAVLILRDVTEQHIMKASLARAESGLRQQGKMEAIGRVSGSIAHDFNNVLTSILGYSSFALKLLEENHPAREDIRQIIAAGERGSALTRQLMDFSHEHAIETHPLDINQILTGIESFLRRTVGEQVELRLQLEQSLHAVKADKTRLEQVLMNLVINARDAMPTGGRILIQTSNIAISPLPAYTRRELEPGDYVLLEVSDTGHGMPPHVMEHIFEPFFTTKGKGKGNGIGLSTVYGIVKQFGGAILCYSEIDKGTTFKIYLPRETAPIEGPAAPAPVQHLLPRGQETLLVVDDEANIVVLISDILTELGYRILKASSPEEALAIAEQCPGSIDLVITDIVMPKMNGPALVEQLRLARPALKGLFMSGYANKAAVYNGILTSDAAFLQKPFSFEVLAASVRETLDKR